MKMDGTGKCVAPSLVSQLPLVPGGIHRSILHDACGAHVGAILTFQDARPVRGRVDGRSDTPFVSPLKRAQERPTGSRGTQPRLPYPGTRGGVCTPIGEGRPIPASSDTYKGTGRVLPPAGGVEVIADQLASLLVATVATQMDIKETHR